MTIVYPDYVKECLAKYPDIAFRPPITGLERIIPTSIGLRSKKCWINPDKKDIEMIFSNIDQLISDLSDEGKTHSFGYPIKYYE